jgi:hypothetical protein
MLSSDQTRGDVRPLFNKVELERNDAYQQGEPEMNRKSAMALFALVVGITLSTAPRAQNIKLYAFSSGALSIPRGPSSSTPATTTK